VGNNFHQRPVGTDLLQRLAPGIEPCAVVAERLSACSLTQIFGLDVVALGALCIIVVHPLFDRMPRTLSHMVSSPDARLDLGSERPIKPNLDTSDTLGLEM
jgi:hypothetical protein